MPGYLTMNSRDYVRNAHVPAGGILIHVMLCTRDQGLLNVEDDLHEENRAEEKKSADDSGPSTSPTAVEKGIKSAAQHLKMSQSRFETCQ